MALLYGRAGRLTVLFGGFRPVQGIDAQHNNRWETLLSVDDYIGEIVRMLEAAGEMDNTYFLFTSGARASARI
jgi:hypothetical protein